MDYSIKQKECASCVLRNLMEYISIQDFHDSALAFSGGLDSTVLLRASSGKLRPYTLGTASSVDVKNASSVSRLLDVQLRIIELDNINIAEYVDIIKKIDPSISRLDLTYELVLAILLDRIPEKVVFTGQGADELFFGYSKFREFEKMDNKEEMDKLMNKTFPREQKIADYFNKDLKTPFLSPGIIECLHGTSKEDHLNRQTNKIILRIVAELLELPYDVVNVPKKAAQYGSGISKLLKNI